MNWIVESWIYDGETLTGAVLRNVDPRDVVGTGGQLVVTGNGDTLRLLIAEVCGCAEDSDEE